MNAGAGRESVFFHGNLSVCPALNDESVAGRGHRRYRRDAEPVEATGVLAYETSSHVCKNDERVCFNWALSGGDCYDSSYLNGEANMGWSLAARNSTAALIAIALAATSSQAAAPAYTLTGLGTLGGTRNQSAAGAINAS